MRSKNPWRAAGVGMLVVLADPGVGAAQEPFVNTPPPPSAICPSIEEDYGFCDDDLLSPNCADFVSAAAALGRLYLFNVQREPGQAEKLKTTVWWDCGSKQLSELRALLVRIDSPQAQAVLQSQPYRSLAPPETAAAPAAPPRPETQPATSPPVDCESRQTAAERSACEASELAAAEAQHQRAFQACEAALPAFLRSQLVAQERSWKTSAQLECAGSGTQCQIEANRQRDEAIRQAFPQCGGAGAAPNVASGGGRHPAKTGMLPAQWTPKGGPTQPVPFSFEAATSSTGTMSTTLGRGGQQFHGSYVLVEKSTKGHLVTAIYDGWSSPEWQMWKHDPDGQWTATGVSFGDFAHFYTGKLIATLAGNQGASMRCQLAMKAPQRGLLAGGSGACQISDGGQLSLDF